MTTRLLGRNSLILTFFIGMAFSLPGVLYLVALKDIAATDQSRAADAVQLVVFNLIMFLAAEIPLLGYAVAPRRTRELMVAVQSWLGKHSRQITIALSGTASALLMTRGLVGLLG